MHGTGRFERLYVRMTKNEKQEIPYKTKLFRSLRCNTVPMPANINIFIVVRKDPPSLSSWRKGVKTKETKLEWTSYSSFFNTKNETLITIDTSFGK